MSSITTDRFLSQIGINNPGAQAKLILEGYLTETELRSAPPLKEDFKNYGFNDFQRNKILQELGKKGSTTSAGPTKRAYVIGTFDTKQTELLYISNLLEKAGVPTVLVDVGLRSEGTVAHVTPQEVANHHPKGSSTIFPPTVRNQSTLAMSLALEKWIQTRDDVGGVIAVGGSCGTSLTTRAMRALPLGVPKVMVSTVASGDVGDYVGTADITMVHSVVDVVGINQISAKVLGNAAHALAGMITLPLPPTPLKPAIALTAFGVTTACVSRIVSAISATYEPLVFHAVGKGGQSMDSLVQSGLLTAVVDVTTTEECDELMGGIFTAGPERLAPLVRAGIPYVGSCGALDMVNFRTVKDVPERYQQRLLFEHNPQTTLMRTTPEENVLLGQYIGKKLNSLVGPVRFLIPEKGVSALDKKGMPFFDPEADEALFRTLEETVLQTETRRLVRVPYHINDPEFADEVVKHFLEIVGTPPHVPLLSEVKGEGEGRRDQRSATSQVPPPQVLYLPRTKPRFEKSSLIQKFQDMAKNRIPIIGGGAGIGLAAKSEEKGGIDLIIIYNSGRYRMAGRGSLAGLLPYGNANEIVLEMAREVLPVVKETPVLAGVNGTDPFMFLDHFLEQIKALGFAGIQNFPTVGLIDGKFGENLEETGMGYEMEVELIRAANSHGLLTSPYIFSAKDAVAMAKAGADILVAHMGLTTGGTIGAQTSISLDDCITIIDEWATAALQENSEILVLCHGGPIATPNDAEYVLQRCKHCHGFYGASSMERLPTEVAIEEQTRKFKSIKF